MPGGACFAVVPVNGVGGRWMEAAAWFNDISLGRCRPHFEVLPAVQPPRPVEYYRASGGKGAWPRNTQALADAIVRSLDGAARAALGRNDGKLLLAVPCGFSPHTWHIPGGGIAVGGGIWVRRYAVLPEDAPLGAVAHELGHLLFDWPDLVWHLQYERECLMARGAAGEHGRNPAPPCAPLLAGVGWRDPLPLTRDLIVADLGCEHVAAIDWAGWGVLVEMRRGSGPRLLVYASRNPGAPPSICARVALTAPDMSRSVLGLVAPYIRRLEARERAKGPDAPCARG